MPSAADHHRDEIVPSSISWVDEALGPDMVRLCEAFHLLFCCPIDAFFEMEPLDATNLWIGNDRSVTALHRDNYENVYCQILGQKHFVLLPPLAAASVNEQWITGATYQPDMTLKLDEEGSVSLPAALWDPDQPQISQSRYSHLCRPMRATLYPGDMLYLPACWYGEFLIILHQAAHLGQVSQSLPIMYRQWDQLCSKLLV